MRVEPLHHAIGAAVYDVDLRAPLSTQTLEEIHSLWMTHLVLLFPGQSITDEEHIAFGKRFGTLEVHPSLAHRGAP